MNRDLFMQCLGEPTRMAILEHLAGGGACVNDLVAATGRSQSNVSHHLQRLRACGFVSFERDGKRNMYTLGSPTIARFFTALDAAVTALEPHCACEVCA